LEQERIDELRRIALNGRSVRVARRVKLRRSGDSIIGVVVNVGTYAASRLSGGQETPYFDLKALGGTVDGAELVKDDWYRLSCSPAALREFVARTEPAPGDVVAAEYRGLEQFSDGTTRHDLVVGLVPKHEVDGVPAEVEAW
jgi:hypothetical protein